MASSTLPKPRTQRLRSKLFLWSVLGIVTLFVFITSEVWLVTDYPLYHSYRLQVIADRALLIPHALFGVTALLTGPWQFSTRLRQRNLQLHRILGRVYVGAVFFAAPLAFAISWGRPLAPATFTQGGAWFLCTAVAFIAARNRQIPQHRAWMARSYAVTFTFITLRVLDPWPRYWNLSDQANVINIIVVTFVAILTADLILSWRDIFLPRRSA
jgi:uncharacterized membrane protein